MTDPFNLFQLFSFVFLAVPKSWNKVSSLLFFFASKRLSSSLVYAFFTWFIFRIRPCSESCFTSFCSKFLRHTALEMESHQPGYQESHDEDTGFPSDISREFWKLKKQSNFDDIGSNFGVQYLILKIRLCCFLFAITTQQLLIQSKIYFNLELRSSHNLFIIIFVRL